MLLVDAFPERAAETEAAITAEGGEASVFQANVTSDAECEAMVAAAIKRYGGLDILDNNVGISIRASVVEVTEEQWDHVMAVNVTGSFLIGQAAARPMVERGQGAIVLTTSTSVLHGVTGGAGQGGPAYVASKGAVIALTRSLARALGPHGVRVNAVSPGITETPMISAYSDEQRDAMLRRFPLGRFAAPEEIANAGLYLISEEASFTTGEVMHVNGGSNFG